MAIRRGAPLVGKGLYADAGLACVVMLIVGMLIVPLPTWLLDLLIATNLGVSVLLLVTALYIPHGLAFTSLPSVLLITTLYRLALNVSSTRLILLQADAGRVIRAFGEFVVRGDYIVGAAVFLIISLIQYLVIARGGERVAEVAARFALDAMPGKQLAIDADLRSGALRVDAAREKRALLERESQFYGAMDGALKFVKGDAIASLVITGIALVAGAAIGYGSRGLSLPATLQVYGLLAIGDGLVSQLPALVSSIAAGLVVTRVAAPEHRASLGQDLVDQLFERPRSFAAASACLLVLAIVPGLPGVPFAILAAVAALTAYGLYRAGAAHDGQTQADAEAAVLQLELGAQLSAAVAPHPQAPVRRALAEHSARAADQLGVPAPSFRISNRAELAPQAYVLRLREAPVLQGQAHSDQELVSVLDSELPLLWQRRARELMSLEDLQQRLDALARRAPALVRNVVPRPLTLTQLSEVMRRLLDENISVRAFERILESLAETPADELRSDRSAASTGIDRALQRARRALRDELLQRHLRDGVLNVHRIDPLIEDAVRDSVHNVAGERVVGLAPELARDVIAAVRRARAKYAETPVLLTQPDIRRSLRDVIAEELPDISVLSYAELPPGANIEQRDPITV